MRHSVDICSGSRPALTGLFAMLCGGTLEGVSVAQTLPQPEAPFKGKIGFSVGDSIPDWSRVIEAPKGAPNIVVILLDDVGFTDTSTFGGIAQTPQLTKLAARGLHFNNFNTTGVCSPTRASLLTGRNHNHAGFGSVTELAGGYPGYNSIWKKDTASVGRTAPQRVSHRRLWQVAQHADWEISPIEPFDRWPTGLRCISTVS